MSEIKLLPCPFCGEGVIYETIREDELGTVIPQMFCNCCKMIFEIENDSPYLSDDKTYEYLKEKLHKQFNTRKPIQEIVENLKISKSISKLLAPSWLSKEDRIMHYNSFVEGIDRAIEIVKEVGEMNETDRD